MTRYLSPSGGGKYVKPKPAAPKSSPKSGNAPPPQYHPPTGVAANPTTRTGDNPRGVRIAPTPRTPKMLKGGANPRGVRVAPPRYIVPHIKKYVPPAVHHSGPGGILGAIESVPVISSIVSGVPHISVHAAVPILKNALHDAENFPASTIEGIQTIAQAGAHDLLGIATGATDVGPGATPVQPAKQHSEIAQLAEEQWKGSVYKPLFEGHVSEALKMFKAHPLNVGLQLTPIVGVVGRVAGITARTGLLGATIKDAGSLKRADSATAPGTLGEIRHFHPNLLVKAVQVAGEHFPKPAVLERALIKHRGGRIVDDIYGTGKAVHRKHDEEVVTLQAKAIKGRRRFKSAPSAKIASDIAAHVVQGVASGKDLIDEVRTARDRIAAEIRDNPGGYDRPSLREAKKHVADMTKFLADPDVEALDRVVDNYVRFQHERIDPANEALGLNEDNQQQMAELMPAIQAGHVPGVRILDRDHGRLSERAALLRKAYQERTRDGRLHLKAAAEANAAGRVGEAAAHIAGSESALRDVKRLKAALDKHGNEKIHGVVADTGVKIYSSPNYAVRPVGVDEIRESLRVNGHDPDRIAYVNLSPPREAEDESRGTFSKQESPSRGDSRRRARTAQGVVVGKFKSGHTALVDSQRQSVARIDRANLFDRLVRFRGYRDPDHLDKIASYTKEGAEKQRAALENSKANKGVKWAIVGLRAATKSGETGAKILERQSGGRLIDSEGLPISADKIAELSPKQRFALIPVTDLKRWSEHVKVDRNATEGAIMPKINRVTRTFRNTVLPFSPRWIAGNVVEAALRSAVAGAGPTDAWLARAVVKRMRELGFHDEADDLAAHMNGLHFGMAHSANEDATGAGALHKPDPSTIRLMAHSVGLEQLAHGYSQLVQGIFTGNQKLESVFDHAAMGAHMHKQMREFGATWKEAAEQQQKWIDTLATKYAADPRLAMDAARSIDRVLGQYDRFSPAAKRIINNVAPFAPWYWNALRFIYWTLPADHPIASAVLLTAAQSAQAQYTAQAAQLGALAGTTFGGHEFPGSLATAIHEKSGGYLDVARFTPAGAFSDGPLGFFTDQVAPQVQGAARALAGQNPFGEALTDKNGDVTDQGQEVEIAISQMALSLLGPADVAERVFIGQGRSEYYGSTLFDPEFKPGSAHGAQNALKGVERTFMPGYPTYLASTDDGGSGGGSGSQGYTGVVGTSGYTGVVGTSGYTGGSGSTGYTGVVGQAGKTVVGR